MNLYNDWKELMENQTDESFESFWETYSSAETRIYKSILEKKSELVTGIVSELAAQTETDLVIFAGFLDGINDSLRVPLVLDTVTADTQLNLSIDFEALYLNMMKAKADYLFTLDEWGDILSEEKRQQIADLYRRSRTVVKEKTPGRNDPCPCGSGKKFKKCCGANQ
ncbi:MAG: hypothetical protein CVU86_03535 [Firmicutes bacterium HGW-Firmicutes-11]|jgi:hypothetical protein|nr:MAG: hypothetical protein CVU86_03535 [Firmicutes bacterium HGW-Firmicutes-11]